MSIDVSPGYVNSISKSIQPDKLSRISAQYPDLNTAWLLTGEGEMLKPETISDHPPITISLTTAAEDRFERLMNIVERQSKQMEAQDKRIDMLLNKIERLEKQESEKEECPNEAASART